MKLDIARAWKDEQYRQALSEDQRNALPVNPVGELSEAEMEMVCGGGGGGPIAPMVAAAPAVHHAAGMHHIGHGPIVVGTSTAASSFCEDAHIHSFGVTCDVNIFSAVQTATLTGVINLLSTVAQICANND